MNAIRRRTDSDWLAGVGLGTAGLAFVAVAVAASLPWVGLGIGGTGLLAGARGPRAALAAVVVDTMFVSAFRRGLAVPLLRPNEVALLGVLLGLAIWAALRGEEDGVSWPRARRLARVTVVDLGFVAVFVLYSAIAAVTQLRSLGPAELGAVLLPVQGWIAYRLALVALTEAADRRRFIILIGTVAMIVVAIGLLQLIDVADLTRLMARWFDSHQLATVRQYHRMTSLVGTYSGLAAVLGLTLAAGAGAWRHGSLDPRARAPRAWVLAAGGGVLALGLLLTGTWAGWIGALIATAIAIWPLPVDWRARLRLPSRRSVVLALLAMGAVLLAAAPTVLARVQRQFADGSLIPQSISYRVDLWQNLFLPAIAQHPLFGVGLTIPAGFGWSTEESLYLQWLFQGGLVGTVGWVLLLASVALALVQASRLPDGWMARVALGALVALLVMGFVNAFLLLSVSSELFWWLVGAALAPIVTGSGSSAGSAGPLERTT